MILHHLFVYSNTVAPIAIDAITEMYTMRTGSMHGMMDVLELEFV